MCLIRYKTDKNNRFEQMPYNQQKKVLCFNL